jgi:predicted O-methyltransferase YrrM
MNLFQRITEELNKNVVHGWCSVPKAHTLAAAVLALRPDIVLEIGIWGGRSFIPMAMAQKEIGKGVVIGIDPWAPAASVEGQVQEADRKHWATADHEGVYRNFMSHIARLDLSGCTRILRSTSTDAAPVENVSLFHLDGNHGPQAIKDVERFAPHVRTGGLMFVDDIGWSGNYVLEASKRLQKMGFTELYKLDTGAMYQRA